jgi:hypothetical protein
MLIVHVHDEKALASAVRALRRMSDPIWAVIAGYLAREGLLIDGRKPTGASTYNAAGRILTALVNAEDLTGLTVNSTAHEEYRAGDAS